MIELFSANEFIDREALKTDIYKYIGRWNRKLKKGETAVLLDLIGIVDKQPTVDAEPVKHGHWIDCKGSNGNDYRKCSECLHTQEITGLLNYCPVCGTRMDEE